MTDDQVFREWIALLEVLRRMARSGNREAQRILDERGYNWRTGGLKP